MDKKQVVIRDVCVIDGDAVDYTFSPCRINYTIGGRPNAAEGPGTVVVSEKIRAWLANVPAYWREKLQVYFAIRGLLVTAPYHADRGVLQSKLDSLESLFSQNNVPFAAVSDHVVIVWESHGIRRQVALRAAEESVGTLLQTFKVARIATEKAGNTTSKKAAPEVPAVPMLEL